MKLNVTGSEIIRLLAACIAAVVIGIAVGCGGGGGGGGNPGNRIGNITNISLVGVYVGTNSQANLAQLAPGDQIQLELLGTDMTTGQPAVVGSPSFNTNAPASVVTVSSTGALVAVSTSATAYRVSGSASGLTFTQNLAVGAAAAKVSGLARLTDGTPESAIPIFFYDKNGNQVGSTLSGTDGTFIANVPTTATAFSANLSTFTGTFYNQYYYGPASYTASVSGCFAPLPAVTVGTTTPLPHDVVLIAYDPNNPPPPPDGCHQ